MSAQETRSETVGFRLSPQQERLLEVDDARSVVQCAAVLAGPVRPEAIRAALEAAIARHEILRTTFPRAVGMRGRSQVIHDALAPEWRIEPGGAATLLSDQASLLRTIAREADRGFDLDRGPLIRVLLLSPSQERAILSLTAHAACADAASLTIILRELVQSPEDPVVQYADYAEWRHELITGEDEQTEECRAFWRAHRESPAPAPALLFGSAGARSSGAPAAVVAVPFDAGELAGLSEGAASAGVSVAGFLEASWHALVARLTGAGGLTLAGWCDGRAQPDLIQAVGPYAQPIPIRLRFQATTSFAEVLDQVRRARLAATRWQDFGGPDDLRALGSSPVGGSYFFEVAPMPGSVLAVGALNPSAGASLLLYAHGAGAELSAELWYDPAACSMQDATELAQRLHTLVASAVADPSLPVARLRLTVPAERARLLAAAAGPSPDPDAADPVHRLFERRVRSQPDAPAVADANLELSYGQLGSAANRLAHLLQAAGVAPGARVGLCMERTPRLLQALLGILKAGGAYVPLSYEHPPARLGHQLSESGAKVLVTEEHLLERLPRFAGEVVCIDRDHDRIAAFGDEDPEVRSAATDLAYVMYTSGSTGLPKGVAVTHGNLANYASHMARRLKPEYPSGERDATARFGVVSAISTDLGNTCIFPALAGGGCVQLISPTASTDAETMAAELGGKALDVLKLTPTHLRGLLEGDHAAAILPLGWLVIGGEALSWELVARVRELSPRCRIVNHYGPTEATIGCCAYDVHDVRADSVTVPIGRPLAGIRAYVLDQSLEPLPPGVPGELCVAGEGVAAGYLGANADGGGAFLNDPFADAPPGRMYRTGDRARSLRDGTIEFLGRLDDQLKIRGFRIEPGEIEAALVRHPDVRQAAVVGEPDDRGQTRLVAYLASSVRPGVEALQTFLSESLPDYMVPSAFATLDALPFTASGKIDRRALAALAVVQTRRKAEYVAPRDELERAIAGIWAQLLEVERVGVFDDFFALGGHSLLATQAIMRIRRLHGEVPLRALLAAPTVAALADAVRSSAAGPS